METFEIVFPMLFSGMVPLLIIFAIAAIIEGKNDMHKSNVIKHVYFYLVSLITLVASVISLGFVLKVGLTSTVFSDAAAYEYATQPPALYLGNVDKSSDASCDGECIYTEDEIQQISQWKGEYTAWLENRDMDAREQSSLVSSLSVLIVAIPLFFIHFRSVQKEAKASDSEEHRRRVIRPTYFYLSSLIGLVMIIVFGSMLVNLGLKTYVFTKADTEESYRYAPTEVDPSVRGSLSAVAGCEADCGFDAETIQYAERYDADFDEWSETREGSSRKQSEAANEIAFLLVAIPLFWYHWHVARREGKESSSV
ncbi:MAG: DUF5671 domain-containing protein [bacterium]|nr:DUF5671 domain-containing protein [bacterium]